MDMEQVGWGALHEAGLQRGAGTRQVQSGKALG